MESKTSPTPISKRRITSNVAAALENSAAYILPVLPQRAGGTSWSINEAAAKAEAESNGRPATLHVGQGEYELDYGELCLRQDNMLVLGQVDEDGEPLTSIVGRICISGASNLVLENLSITAVGAGICIDGGASCHFRNCYVVGCGASGIYICQGSSLDMDTCDVEQNALHGIYISGKGSTATIRHSEIKASVTGTGRAVCVSQGGKAHLEGTIPTLEGAESLVGKFKQNLPSPMLTQDSQSTITQSEGKGSKKLKSIQRKQSFVDQQNRIEEREVRLRPEGLPKAVSEIGESHDS